MLNLLKIKIIRSSDSAKFEIGEGSDWRFLKGGLDGFGSLSNSLEYTDNAIADGGIITSSRVGKTDRTIEFAYMHRANNDVARKNALAFFNVKDSFKVYITYGDRTVWAEGYLYKLKANMSVNLKDLLKISVTFMFANPYWKSFDDFGKNIASVSGMTAFPYLCNVNVGTTGGVFNFAKIVTLYNDGDVDTQCKASIIANGDVINPKLIINDEYVRVIDEMSRGDVIDIDFTATPPTVRKNGVNFIGHCDRTSAFDSMILGRGDNTVQFDADNGSSNLNVTIYYNKLYEAI